VPSSSNYVPNREASAEVRATIASFRRSDYTVAAMIADGFTHLEGTCSKCGSIVLNPFRMMLNAGRITSETTLGRISAAYICKKCGGRQAKGGVLQPTYQYMGTPADTYADSPVSRRLQKP
jgi:hypothetical protein